ncbi:aspartate/glutamate racemase family protein [Citromicrobium bathyomarinum]|uniref:aspartate/glutamate racemase family protein n=1 Tax=Citromicrobium bathyomarinum TaxID=72174 RepID=UPI003159D2A6
MRKFGLIGGMSWVSTAMYYKWINKGVAARAGAMVSAPLLIESLNFAELSGLTSEDEWDRAAEILADSAKRLEAAGAEALAIAANSMHRVYDQVADAVDVPVLHIADAVGEKMKAEGAVNAALIGTRNVMTESFYRKKLVSHGIDLLPPDMTHVDRTNEIIYDELMYGKASRNAERFFRTMITNLEQDGAKAIVLACTELDMVIDVDANVLPIFDSARIHSQAVVDWIMGEGA